MASELIIGTNGNIYAKKTGRTPELIVTVAAHIDEIGCSVRDIDANGFIRLDKLGASSNFFLPGIRVRIGRTPGTIGIRSAQPRSGLAIKVDRRFSVSLQDRARRLRGDRALQAGLNGLGFSFVRHTANNCRALHDLLDRHGNRSHGNLLEAFEPTFSQLLPAAGFVETNQDVRSRGFEVRRRVIEGDVTIFPDSDEGHIDRMLTDQS